MSLAVTVWNDRIAPVFDCAGTVVLFADGERVPIEARRLQLPEIDQVARVARLREAGVTELICGAISRDARNLVLEEGIALHPFIAGNVREVLDAWSERRLYTGEFFMPGCGFGRQRRCRRRGNGRMHGFTGG